MQSIQKKGLSTKSKVALAVVALLIIGGGAAAYAHFRASQAPASNNNAGKVEPAPPKLSDEDAKAKEEFIKNNEPKKGDGSSTVTPAEQKDTPKIELTAKQEDDGSVTVITKLYGLSDGTCSLTAQNGSKSIERSAQVIYQPSYSSCAGFSIPKSDLGAGSWQISLTATATSGLSTKANTSFDVQ